MSEPEISVSAVMDAHADELKASNLVGERFGKYLLVGEIATGGMAEVFLAVHKGLEGFVKVVVIKRVLQHLTNNAEYVRMFIDEARLAARLEHPNIVRTYEFGEVDGQYFTAMEYLPGEDLCKALNNLVMSRQFMPLHVAAGIASQLCEGLYFAHQLTDVDGNPLHLVHRDINPANIVVTYGGEVKIIDFGVAKSNAHANTIVGTIKGKIAYMPPEQVLGRSVDQRADIFSAGVVLWELLTGRPLFVRDSEAATLYAVMKAPIPPPSRIRAGVPARLDQITLRALARSVDDRYQTAAEMAADLDELRLGLPRYDARTLSGLVESVFGSTRADAKRSIAQTRSLSRNVSLVMKMRTEIRDDLAERLDAAEAAHGRDARGASIADPGSGAPRPQPRSHRGLVLALAGILLAAIAAGLGYALTRSSHEPPPQQIVQTALELDSTPSGAAVFVGGEPTGLKTPTTLTGITAPHLVIRLELPGHTPVTEDVAVPAGTTTVHHVALTAQPGRLVISDLPASAVVLIDGDEHAAGEVIPVTAGTHDVRILLDGRTISQQAIETTAGDQGWKLARGKLIPSQ
ncbi:MAG TPA: serine/threonine-protein kinase [Kofleriaceae bacterium]|nr:serine/threonine-protein kinase [Kofleriaceae bacterium]